MSDHLVVTAALGAMVAALVAVQLPAVAWAALLVVAGVGVATRRPVLVVVALLALVSGRSHLGAASLAAPLPEQVAGRAQLASDPESGRFATRAVVRIGARRYLAEFPRDAPPSLAEALTGEHLELRGRPAPLRSAPTGWVRSEHLAGRLAVSSVEVVGDPAPWYRVANGVHRTIGAGARSFPDQRRPLYLGLVLGDDRDGSELTEHRFRVAGLAHLLAVSGQNVAFVLAVAAPLLVRLGRWPRAAAALALLVVFVLVTRADPSVLRAGVMAGVAVLAAATGRIAPGIRVLGLTVLVLLVVDPLLVHSIGFRLSVCATAGLLVLTRPIAQRLPGPTWLAVPAAVTLAAQAATAPVLLAFTGAVPTVATVANLLAGPAAGAVMMLGVSVGLLAGLVREPLAEVLQLPARTLVAWIDLVATAASRSGAPLLTPRQASGVAALAAGLLAVRSAPPDRAGSSRPSRRPRARAVVLALGGLAAAVAICWPRPLVAGEHEVGRGARLLVARCGTTLHLVDDRSGPVLDDLARLGVRRIDTVLAAGAARAASADVEAQLTVLRVIDPADPADPGGSGDPGGRIGAPGVPCSLPP